MSEKKVQRFAEKIRVRHASLTAKGRSFKQRVVKPKCMA